MEISFRKAQSADFPQIYELLSVLFRPTYGRILSEAQMTYMLNTCFSEARLLHQFLNEGHEYGLMCGNRELLGFYALAYDVGTNGCCKLHKLYLRRSEQGRGWGFRLLDEAVRDAGRNGQQQMILNVNRGNSARTFYARFGFEVVQSVDIPIGNGYFMNDFVMQRNLSVPLLRR